MKNKERVIGLDIIRVIAVLFVLCVHFFLNTKYYTTEFNGIGMKLQYIIRNIFMICVPLFILLTGYLNKKKEYNKEFFKELIIILIIWLFYSIIEYPITNMYKFTSIKDYIFQITNFKASRYSWYLEMYIGLYLLSPLINNGYNSLKQKDKNILLILSIILFIAPGFINDLLKDIIHFPNWWYSIYPLGYYITGKYLSETKPNYNKLFLIGIYILNQIIIFMVMNKAKTEFESLTIYISSVIVFLIFYNINIKNKCLSKIITTISILSLDIYLASGLTDRIIYTIFNNKLYLYNIPQSRCILYAPLVIISTFILSTLYASIRRKIIRVR